MSKVIDEIPRMILGVSHSCTVPYQFTVTFFNSSVVNISEALIADLIEEAPAKLHGMIGVPLNDIWVQLEYLSNNVHSRFYKVFRDASDKSQRSPIRFVGGSANGQVHQLRRQDAMWRVITRRDTPFTLTEGAASHFSSLVNDTEEYRVLFSEGIAIPIDSTFKYHQIDYMLEGDQSPRQEYLPAWNCDDAKDIIKRVFGEDNVRILYIKPVI